MMDGRKLLVALLVLVCLGSCSGEQQKQPAPNSSTSADSEPVTGIFSKLPSSETGITFSNVIDERDGENVLDFSLLYNGGGVAIADINNDGLSDIFFTGNMVSSRLYLNKGELEFEDITESAGITTERWITGASMVDIDGNGYIDIYLSVASREEDPENQRANLLYLNNGDNTFTEAAVEYGIASTRFTTHAAFLDYNRDGLLDLFLLNHSPGTFSREMGQSIAISQNPSADSLNISFDQLYRNNGNGTFTEVSREAGILERKGYGLGVAVGDLNRDGWPDIYISNDIAPDDVLYMNNGDGTFTDQSRSYLKHTTYAGMGVDIADFNNDGWPDIFQTGMMPEDLEERKGMSYGTSFEQFNNLVIDQGYNYSYNLNALQLNNGIDPSGHLKFSEVARIAGVAYTDWSWATLFGDYDNDGHKDLMVTNGYPKATNDFDFIVEMHNTSDQDKRSQVLENLKNIRIPNYLFQNNGTMQFSDVTKSWGFGDSTYSYGAAHGDLDNDGDLELIINNLNEPASIYKNNTIEQSGNHYLTIQLNGPRQNSIGIGTEVVITLGEEKQYLYQSPYRGYQSSVDTRLHFGLEKENLIDSLEVFWPDGSYQLLTGIEANQQLTLDYNNASDPGDPDRPLENIDYLFKEVTSETGLVYEHNENNFIDYQVQPLLMQQMSRLGPRIATGDVNGDGLEDLYVGGAANSAGVLYLQQAPGQFEEANDNQPWLADASSEDMGAVFFDANGDGSLDLYVASGGYEFFSHEDNMLDRLYINTGEGRFIKDESALPRMYTSSSVVTPGDFNGDGSMDLFVGGRLFPQKYPYPARSYLLLNEGGTFRDVTKDVAPGLVEPGMITDAEWIDFNGDGQLDLVMAGTWLPIQFYQMSSSGQLEEVTDEVIEQPLRGWWYSLETGDFNKDGKPDIVAGNLGLNHTFSTSREQKFGLFANDFNNDLTTDLIYTVQRDSLYYPFFGKGRLLLGKQRFIHEQYPTFSSMKGESMSDIFEERDLNESLKFQADTFASMVLLSKEEGGYSMNTLPDYAQISPINGIVSEDVDQDGNLDLIIAGNIFATHPDISRADAGNGLLLKGDGDGNFESIPPFRSGLWASGDVKTLKIINTPEYKLLLVANNDDRLQVFRIE
ncbi:VCBS repeat-containing protein [Halalkalibaculum sp. DA3122]|uniref:VCBS repeat-containing protein n=1 Tax=Halalkalibaculum sp. DA3122 TaxID=3373607 RepID=UPI003753FD38